ncbi:MAG: glycerophosphodiester phosphodiesterase [Clostridiales bacterium]|nr:glycerophosphodiester phosphodiesterase [Clostridiales bacterium]
MGIALCLIVLMTLYLWLIATEPRRPEIAPLLYKLYAHRGLHDGNHRVIENSLEAFRLAVEAGYGIELDVQPTRDGKLVVFHDESLKRLCGVDLRIGDMTWEELGTHPLPDGSSIPLFDQVLALVNGQAPLIVEIKHYGDAKRNAALTLQVLRTYSGPFCVESFHPLAVRYFRREASHILRGQLANGGKRDTHTNFLQHFAMKYLLVNGIGRPHFVSYSCGSDHTLSVWMIKRIKRALLAAWTIRDQETLDRARKEYQMYIFEGFHPDD